ncbi:hypothetical protein I4U23_004152 [Adineta vaga]|nr:hypothetical protein I4U23_004152 [Adineta vaga]
MAMVSTSIGEQLLSINIPKKIENIILVWFDPDNALSDVNTYFQMRLSHLNNWLIFHSELDSCMTFLKSIETEKLFLITSNSSILSHINDLNQIVSIFMFNTENIQNKHPKIIGIYNEFDSLCLSIEEQINLIDQRFSQWSFFNQDQYATIDLTQQSSDFLWLQLLHKVILYLPRNETKSRKQMIDTCRLYYHDNIKELALIDEFEEKYQSDQAISCYMKCSFLRRIISRALRTEDTDQLYLLRDFLRDLIENFTHEYQNNIDLNTDELLVYRGMMLSNDELNQLKKNQHKLMAMKDFFIGYRSRSLALTSIPQHENLNSVLFEIEFYINQNIIFVNTTDILFDFNATFYIENIQQDNKDLWIVKLIPVQNGERIIEKYIHDVHRQYEDLSLSIIFGKLICDMSQWNQSQTYFEHLLNDSPNEDFAWIEFNLGQTHHWKGEWNKARVYYDQAYQRLMQTEPNRIKDSAIVLSTIGELLYRDGKYEEAYDYHQRALEIRKTYYSENHISIATSLENIGLIHEERRMTDKAILLFQQAIAMREEYFCNYRHVSIGSLLWKIGFTFIRLENFSKAYDSISQALIIYENYYSSGHVYAAIVLNYLATLLCYQELFDESCDFVQRAWSMQKKFYPFGHADMLISAKNLSDIKNKQEMYNESLDLLQQALQISNKYYSSSNTNTSAILTLIGWVFQNGEEDYEQAQNYYDQALTILERHYPSYHEQIAETFFVCSSLLVAKKKYLEALDIYKEVLQVLDNYHHMDTIIHRRIFNGCADVLCKLTRYDEALEYFQKALRIQEKFYGSSDWSIGNILFRIGMMRHVEEGYEEAMQYYQQSLTIFRKYSPGFQMSTSNVLGIIADVFSLQGKYDEAFEYKKQALDIRQRYYPSIYKPIVICLNFLGEIRKLQGQYDDAVHFFQESLDVFRIYNPSDQRSIVKKLKYIADIHDNDENYDQAINYYQQCVNILEKYYPEEYIEISELFNEIAKRYFHQENWELAIEYFIKCSEIQEINLGTEHRTTIVTLVTFVLMMRMINRYDLSLTYALKCLLAFEKTLPPDEYDIGRSLFIIGECYQHFNDQILALEYYKRALHVYEQTSWDSHEELQEVKTIIQDIEQVLNAQPNIQAVEQSESYAFEEDN